MITFLSKNNPGPRSEIKWHGSNKKDSMRLTDRRKTAKSLVDSRKN